MAEITREQILLQQAIAAIKAGDKADGRRLLVEAIRSDPRSEAAWLWMSAAVDSDEQRRTCLEQVLAINPGNQTAQRGLARLSQTVAEPIPPPPATPTETAVGPWPATGPATREALSRWSFFVALSLALLVFGAVGLAAYLALACMLRGLRRLARLPARRRDKATGARSIP